MNNKKWVERKQNSERKRKKKCVLEGQKENYQTSGILWGLKKNPAKGIFIKATKNKKVDDALSLFGERSVKI